ncbi:hypothetical protein SDC9_197483 [bioreactor metagenome]|uniref:Uncharacterized protein n=1 Tax=bioreactor metagenome TaxID=1076179 RepID=A0A645IHA2_9ZZZZ
MNLLCHTGIEIVEGGKAVFEEHLGIGGSFQQIHRHLILLEQLHTLFGLVLLAHRYPDISVDYINTLHRLIGVGGNHNLGTA